MKTFKSEAQRRKLAQLVRDGKIKQSDYDKMTYDTGRLQANQKVYKPLPERVTPPKKK